jgi:hypothetical protein
MPDKEMNLSFSFIQGLKDCQAKGMTNMQVRLAGSWKYTEFKRIVQAAYDLN